MDNRSYLGSISKFGKIGEGSFSEVFKCDFYDSYFAYKEYKDENYVKFINERIKKLTSFYNDTRLTFPYELIYKKPTDEFFVGYVMDPKDNYLNLFKYKNLDYDKKIVILKKARELIDILHKKYKIIHTDLNLCNIMYNIEKNDITLIDFDTYINLDDKKGYQDGFYNDFVSLYLNHNSIDKDLDIFLFNMCCFAFINNIDYFSVLDAINNNYYKDINSVKAIEIFNSYKDIECKKCLKKEYVIDYL